MKRIMYFSVWMFFYAHFVQSYKNANLAPPSFGTGIDYHEKPLLTKKNSLQPNLLATTIQTDELKGSSLVNYHPTPGDLIHIKRNKYGYLTEQVLLRSAVPIGWIVDKNQKRHRVGQQFMGDTLEAASQLTRQDLPAGLISYGQFDWENDIVKNSYCFMYPYAWLPEEVIVPTPLTWSLAESFYDIGR